MTALNPAWLENAVRVALAEDQGSGDATTLSVVPAGLETTALMQTREACVVAGLPVAAAVFKELDPEVCFEAMLPEGARAAAGQLLARVTGKAQALLTGERVALNFVQRLCGIATMSRAYVDAVGTHKAKILDTRKTTPGLRFLEKYAVLCGGAQNHRFGLYDRVMIKDNHRELAKLSGPDSIQRAVAAARARYPKLEVEVEADTFEDVKAALEAGAEHIMLDNMTDAQMTEAVVLIAGRAKIEASGGITLARIPSAAATGVDFISIGALTHSVRSIDIGLDIHTSGSSASQV